MRNYNMSGVVMRSQAKSLKVKRSPSVPVVDLADCPDCPARVGDKCIGADGFEKSHTHRGRRRLAVRAQNKARLSAPADTLDTTTTEETA